jgi:hypothetical protein
MANAFPARRAARATGEIHNLPRVTAARWGPGTRACPFSNRSAGRGNRYQPGQTERHRPAKASPVMRNRHIANLRRQANTLRARCLQRHPGKPRSNRTEDLDPAPVATQAMPRPPPPRSARSASPSTKSTPHDVQTATVRVRLGWLAPTPNARPSAAQNHRQTPRKTPKRRRPGRPAFAGPHRDLRRIRRIPGIR